MRNVPRIEPMDLLKSLDMNLQLQSIYESALGEFYRAIPPAEDISRPLLLAVPDSYHRAEIKLMVVGQQTKNWGDGYTSASDLMQFYREFDLARTYRGRNSPFWRAARKVHNGLNPHGPERAFLWSNLVKVDQRGKRPTPAVEETVSRLGLLPKEIAVTRPDAVVFLTGPKHKERLCETFPSVEYQLIS